MGVWDMQNQKLNIYLAAPMFSVADQEFNDKLTSKLEKHYDVFLPQRDAGTITSMLDKGVPADHIAIELAALDEEGIRKCDMLLAVISSKDIDDGTACEIGFASALNKVCIGLHTDSRRSDINLFVESRLDEVFNYYDLVGAYEIISHAYAMAIGY